MSELREETETLRFNSQHLHGCIMQDGWMDLCVDRYKYSFLSSPRFSPLLRLKRFTSFPAVFAAALRTRKVPINFRERPRFSSGAFSYCHMCSCEPPWNGRYLHRRCRLSWIKRSTMTRSDLEWNSVILSDFWAKSLIRPRPC